ncbi:MAG TPA: hypothetical protein VGR21_08005 [Cryptosporangiaceae bacterium]|nr:hypothetical protein [Cryptosporangiaceae bacterium]
MAEFRVRQHATGHWTWTMVSADGTALLARSARSYADESTCRAGLSEVLAAVDCAVTIQNPDGFWGWHLCGEDGLPVATAAESYRSAHRCGEALRLFQYLARDLGEATLLSRVDVRVPRPRTAA